MGLTLHATKRLLLDTGLAMMLERGYNDLGIQALLEASGVPRGSFYHHFRDKEDFALQVVDRYMEEVHVNLDACLRDKSSPPLSRIRGFLETTRENYRDQGYLGCLLGGLGQELSGVNATFRRKIQDCFSTIAARFAECLDEARDRGDIPPTSDTRQMADLLIDCWEGAALRTRLRRDAQPLETMLDFYFGKVAAI